MRARFEKVVNDPRRSFHVEERRLAKFDVPWHFHPEIELTLIVKSCGRRFVGDSIEPFAEGDLVLLGPNLPHFWQNEEPRMNGRQSHSVVVQFQPDFLGGQIWARPEFGPIQRLIGRATRGLHFTGAIARDAAAAMRTLPKLSGMAALTHFLTMLESLALARDARPLASLSFDPSLNRKTEKRLSRVYGYAAAHFQENITLPQLAKVAAMSPAAFSRFFKQATGRAPSDFLNDLRIEHVCRLLRESDRSITEIASSAGYSALTNFNRRFRERTGTTPRDYRNSFSQQPATSQFLS
jgi:AraC-like DNA-binding protein